MALELPLTIVGKIDVSRTARELEALDEFLNQSAIRIPGSSMTLPKLSRNLDDLALNNQLNLLDIRARTALKNYLVYLKEQGPSLHMSFAADPSAAFVQRVLRWLRQEVHPEILLQIGLQPTIAAGTVVRTPNMYLDFSMRQHFSDTRGVLIDLISTGGTGGV